MEESLAAANVVILASSHNPTIVCPDWVQRRRIIDEAPENFIHTPQLSIFVSKSYQLVVEQEKLQLVLKTPVCGKLSLLSRAATQYVMALPETPYRAVGVNVAWDVAIGGEKGAVTFSRRLFVGDQQKLALVLGDDEFRVGGILTTRRPNHKLTIRVEPVVAEKREITFGFNFHFDVTTAEGVADVLQRCEELCDESRRITQGLMR